MFGHCGVPRTPKSTPGPIPLYPISNSISPYSQKVAGKGNTWALNFGLQPISRINYKIQKNERKPLPPLSDSLVTIYEGNGGLNKFNIGTAMKFKNLRIGVSSGYAFGSKDFSTRLAL